MFSLLKKFAADRSGATAIEYGLIAAGVAVAIVATVNFLGDDIDAAFTEIETEIDGQAGG